MKHPLLSLVLVLCLLAGFPVAPAEAGADTSVPKIVRTGYTLPDPNVPDPSAVPRTGYIYEYQQMIASFNNWQYEYVYHTWSQMLKELENGDIDLMANVSYTPERAKKYDFSAFPLRIETYYIFVPVAKADEYPNAEALRGKKVGVARSTTTDDQLREWNEKNQAGIKIVEFKDFQSRRDALDRGDIDAIAEFTSRVEIGTYVVPVVRYGSSNSYIAVSKKRPDILKEVNEALAMINVYNPAFQVNLSQKYFLHSADAAILTAEDRLWFKKHGTIRIGYLRHMAPFIEEGPDGEARGMFRDLINHGFKAFELDNTVEYVPYDDPDELKQDLIAHKINAALPVYDTPWEDEKLHLLQTPNVVSMQMYCVSRTDEPTTKDTIIAVADDLPPQLKFVKEYFPDNEIRHYKTEDEVIEALHKGEADAAFMNPYLISIYLQGETKLHQTLLDNTENLTIAVSPVDHPLFMAISRMNTLWGESSIRESLLRHTDESFVPSFWYFVQRHYKEVLLLTAFGVMLLTFIIAFAVFRTRQKRQADRIARHDFLTGLENRRAYDEQILALEKNPPQHCAISMIDINGLKAANDTIGHKAGDELIRGVAACLKKTFADPRCAGAPYFGYRIGGDEFTVIGLVDDALFCQIVETFRGHIAAWKGEFCDALSISFGWASHEEFPEASIDELLHKADKRMYADKAAYYRQAGIDRRKH
ncbi:diguanylate cyclase domain-containing protein [Mitsuokella sp. WILCCON 0060]|uniref:transporter substrate-binding domain-containing diguanylate cyclase n=1 Tax=Mitsuokella sp. WILCCON 0060 TaxID=3345341 RepID=UPI003F1B8F97